MSKRVCAFLCLFLLSGAVLSDATPDEVVSIGPHQISIPMPPDNCMLRNVLSNHKRVLEYLRDSQKGAGQVVYASTDCLKLAQWTMGLVSSLTDLRVVVTPIPYLNQKLTISRKQFVLHVKKQYMDLGVQELARTLDDIARRIDGAIKDMPLAGIDETKILGILSQDESALYLGMTQVLTTETGENMRQLGAGAITLVNGKVLFLNLYTIYQGPETVHELVALSKEWVNLVQSAN